MNQTFQNSAQVLSIGIFFTLMIVGLALDACRTTLTAGLQAHGVPRRRRAPASPHLPPVSILFAAFLGYNPIEHLLGAHVLALAAPAGQGGAHRPHVLPEPDLGPVQHGAPRGVHLRDHRLPGRSRRIADARRQIPAQRGGR